MKILIASLFITSAAFAYNSSTVGNHPIREEMISPEKRVPASDVKHETKPSEENGKKILENKK